MGGSTTKLHEPNYSNTATNMSGLEDVDASEVTYSSNYDAADECSTFDEMNLKEDLLRGIYAYGFEKPSTIQQRAIIPIVKGEDTIAQAQSGTGKTATFTIGVLQRVDLGLKQCQALILAPYRSLWPFRSQGC